ncbi:MAG TPA: division/cell wall cluster transcriptional repressor MraZ [Planctomycetes bacterium]|nr:division/cell wall cluster transcriptional repressor MraZ [Planctomycetota bacterium]
MLPWKARGTRLGLSGGKWGSGVLLPQFSHPVTVARPRGSGKPMNARFMGQFEHTLDEKGRVIVPSKWREQIGGEGHGARFIATGAPEPCVWIFSLGEWDRIHSQYANQYRGDFADRELTRNFFGKAEELATDDNGRVLLTRRLRRWAGLERELVLVGCYVKAEIWNADFWEERERNTEAYNKRIQDFHRQHEGYSEHVQRIFGGKATGE